MLSSLIGKLIGFCLKSLYHLVYSARLKIVLEPKPNPNNLTEYVIETARLRNSC